MNEKVMSQGKVCRCAELAPTLRHKRTLERPIVQKHGKERVGSKRKEEAERKEKGKEMKAKEKQREARK